MKNYIFIIIYFSFFFNFLKSFILFNNNKSKSKDVYHTNLQNSQIQSINSTTSNSIIMNEEILQNKTKKEPFSSIKFIGDQLFVSLDDKTVENWHLLLSLNNIGIDALINFSKQHYGIRYCDLKIECYKFHIIKHINKVYKSFQNEDLPEKIPIELQDNIQNGMDIEQTHEKYMLNRKRFEENVLLSKNRFLRPNGLFSNTKIIVPLQIPNNNHLSKPHLQYEINK